MPVPLSILAGVVSEFSVPVPSDFNGAAGYTLVLALVNAGRTITVAADKFTANGDAFDGVIPAATTADYAPGKYNWHAIAINGSDKRLISQGALEIVANVLAATAGADTRSHAAIMLDSIEAVLRGKATNDQKRKQLDGLSLERYDFKDLEELRDKYRREVQVEATRSSGKLSNKIQFTFSGN